MKPTIELRVMQGHRTAIAEVTVTDTHGDTKVFTGESKKHPRDRYDSEIGVEYAIGRALQMAGETFITIADFRVSLAAALH
jgi:hypothetical protein